jgi:hypothetical protein
MDTSGGTQTAFPWAEYQPELASLDGPNVPWDRLTDAERAMLKESNP